MEQVRLAELLEDKVYKAWFDRPPEDDTIVCRGKRWAVWYQDHRGGKWNVRTFKKWKKAHKTLTKLLQEPMPIWDGALVDQPKGHKPPLLKTQILLPNGKVKKHPTTKEPMYRRYWWPFPATVDPLVNEHGVGHYWCPHCRRPTVFRFFKKHHAFHGRSTIGWDLRCTICGVRRSFIRDYYKRWGGK